MGICIGKIGRSFFERLPLSRMALFGVLALLFIMGGQIGANHELLVNLRMLGVKTLLITAGALVGTIATAVLFTKSNLFRF